MKLFKKIALAAALVLGLSTQAVAQITVPNTLTAGATIRANELNTNFTDIASKALNRISGGTIEGNITLLADVTIDGVDISDFLISTGEIRSQTAGTVAAPSFSRTGDVGTGLYFPAASQLALSLGGVQRFLLNASGLTIYGVNIIDATGKIPALTAPYFTSLDGSALTNITAATATNFSGSLAGDITGTQGATAIGAGVIVDADINAAAGIVDTKLAQIATSGKVANSATTGVSTATANTLMLRDASANVSVNNVVAALLHGTSFRLGNTATAGHVLTADVNGNGTWAALPSGTIGGSGTAGRIAKFSAATTIADSIMSESGTTLSVFGAVAAQLDQVGDTVITVTNATANAASHATLRATTNTASGGDPKVSFLNSGVLEWTIGQDTSASNTFKIASSGALDGNTRLSISSAGVVTVHNTLTILGGTPGAGKVLTSDASGNATWAASSTASVPSGAILLFDAACPTGYTRFIGLDNRFPRGNSAYGATGGTDAHTHTWSGTSTSAGSHSHTFSGDTSTTGAHTHTMSTTAVTPSGAVNAVVSTTTSENGNHLHTYSGSTSSIAAHAHDVSGTTASTGNLPPYLNMIYCKKD